MTSKEIKAETVNPEDYVQFGDGPNPSSATRLLEHVGFHLNLWLKEIAYQLADANDWHAAGRPDPLWSHTPGFFRTTTGFVFALDQVATVSPNRYFQGFAEKPWVQLKDEERRLDESRLDLTETEYRALCAMLNPAPKSVPARSTATAGQDSTTNQP